MRILDDLKMYARFTAGLPGFLRKTITLEEARAIIRSRLAARESNFLMVVEKGIFGNPRSPYRPLLELAGCGMGDIRAMVRDRGVEGTLMALREAGVYFTFEEFKGRQPAVRGEQVIKVDPRDFDNPLLSKSLRGETGGTTGAGSRVSTDLDHLAAHAPYLMVTWEAHGVLDIPKALWRGILPDASGINYVLRAARFKQVPERWFTHLVARDLRISPKYKLATYATLARGGCWVCPCPGPRR
jgi:hypothetical protein